MREIFPINKARELAWNGRRVYTTQALTAVAHLVIESNRRVTNSVGHTS